MLDYSSPSNQLYAMLHFGFSFLLLMVVLPKFFVSVSSEDRLEDRVGRFSVAVCLYIAMGYILVVLQLYEVISVLLVIGILSTRRFWRKGSEEVRSKTVTSYSVWFYELTEIGFRLKTRWKQWTGKLTMIRKEIHLKNVVKGDPLLTLILVGVLAVAAYVRFYDAAHHAPPATSDGVVTLAWMKYISQRILFHDGIYPQGFHIILSMYSKFAAIDELYILKYTGPLNGVLTSLGYYFCLSRLTGNKAAGIVGAALFGFGGTVWFGGDWERQAATNAQEFAMVFVFPSLYFILRYLKEGKRWDLWSGIAACAAAGFVHSLMLAYVGMGIGVALIASLLSRTPHFMKRAIAVSILSIAAVIVTYAPIQIATWEGETFHESSASFLTETAAIDYPVLTVKDYAGLCSIGIIALSALLSWKNRSHRTLQWFAVGMGTATFVLYYFVPHYTQSVMLFARTPILWTMYSCFGVGIAWWSIWRFIPELKTTRAVELTFSGVFAILFAVFVQLKPIEVYKMQWESEARAYLKIAEIHQPMTWTIFSNDQDYALVYGNGYHQYLRTLIEQYDPTGTPITRVGQNEYDPDVTPWMYVFEQKKVYKVSEFNDVSSLMQKRYAEQERDNKDLEAWLNKYEPVHGRPPIVYEDENLRIYLLERPDAKDKRIRRIWGAS